MPTYIDATAGKVPSSEFDRIGGELLPGPFGKGESSCASPYYPDDEVIFSDATKNSSAGRVGSFMVNGDVIAEVWR